MDCKNCHTSLSENADYCYSCGGKVIRNRMTFRNLFDQFSETFLNYDNKFLQTFIGLFKNPEIVIGSYIDGTRKKYVDVVSYFALAITLSGLQIYILNKFYPEAMDMSAFTLEGQEEWNNGVMQFIQEYQALVMMSYVPIYALIARIVFYNKKEFNYTENLVIFMFIQAQISITSAIVITSLFMFGIDFFTLGWLMFPAMIGYSAYCLKRLYRLSLAQMILKTLLFFLIFVILSVFIIIGGVIIGYFSGGFDAMIEAKKAAKGI